jgi:hypothetical protein
MKKLSDSRMMELKVRNMVQLSVISGDTHHSPEIHSNFLQIKASDGRSEHIRGPDRRILRRARRALFAIGRQLAETEIIDAKWK